MRLHLGCRDLMVMPDSQRLVTDKTNGGGNDLERRGTSNLEKKSRGL